MTRQARIVAFPIITVLVASAAATADPTITRFVIAGGGGQSAGGTFTLTGTIGQPLAGGTLTAGSLTLTSGFWARPPGCPADADGNGLIQPADVAAFINTWSASLSGGTLAGDFDGNGVVQPADVGAFVNAWFTALSSGC